MTPNVKPKPLLAAAEVYASQDSCELPTPSDIEGTAEDLRDPIRTYIEHPDADLVPRSMLDVAIEAKMLMERQYYSAQTKYDEARAQVAALHKVLEAVKQCCLFSDDDGQIGVTADPHIDERLLSDICAALTDTEEAATQFKRVPEGYVIMARALLERAFSIVVHSAAGIDRGIGDPNRAVARDMREVLAATPDTPEDGG